MGEGIRDYIYSLPDGDYILEVKPLPPAKSAKQMAYYRGVILPAFGKAYGERDINKCHNTIKAWLNIETLSLVDKDEFSLIIQKVTDKILELGGEIPDNWV